MRDVNILLVDDDIDLLRTLEAVLAHQGFNVIAVSSVPEALEQISNRSFDVLLSDLNVGQPGDGFTVVSAMRRVQPNACTFILTGYPDFESAISAIRNQVDDYFLKPLDVEQLVEAVSAAQQNRPRRIKTSAPQSVARLLRGLVSEITQKWLEGVLKNSELAALPLSNAERIDHLPEVLKELGARLECPSAELSATAVEAARAHGRTRFHQGYTISQLLFESRVLQKVISATIQENLLSIELSTMVNDILEIGQSLQAELEISIQEYQAQIPRSLQTSFSALYKSPYLGVLIADESRVLDANQAFLRMIGRTSEDLLAGEIDWRSITPDKFRLSDDAAIDQLREFGACAPFEKEFVLANGQIVPFLIGAIRLNTNPLEWSAYVVDLTEHRRAIEAEQKIIEWKAKNALINELAHEINNPLAALMFSTHLLSTHPSLTDDMRLLLRDIGEMLMRVAHTTQRVLAESKALGLQPSPLASGSPPIRK